MVTTIFSEKACIRAVWSFVRSDISDLLVDKAA